MNCASITYSAHAIRRMFERKVSTADIELVLNSGLVIEDHPNDYPYPSFLLLGINQSTPVHVAAAKIPTSNECIVVTVYVPEPSRWSADFKTRKKS